MSDYGRVWENCGGGIADARRNAKKVAAELAAQEKPTAEYLAEVSRRLLRYSTLIKQYEHELNTTSAQDR
jgi:hypothetical protein